MPVMTQWEYCLRLIPNTGAVEMLNQLGLAGWELVSVNGHAFWLKRPLQAPSPDSPTAPGEAQRSSGGSIQGILAGDRLGP